MGLLIFYTDQSKSTDIGKQGKELAQSANGCDVTKRAIIDVNSIVSGRNYDILASIIAQLMMPQPFCFYGSAIIVITRCLSIQNKI